jgi:hypothetical protein
MSDTVKVMVLIAVVAVIIFVVWKVIDGVKETAELTALASPVKCLECSTQNVESVSVGSTRTMYEGDGVNVEQRGRAELEIAGCSLDIFQSSGLQWTPSTRAGAPVCTVDMSHGTLVASVDTEMVLNTEWCVIRTLGTKLLVRLNPARGLLWIIVREGRVEVVTASERVVVQAGQQTWVRRDGWIAPVRPATRGEVGELFPVLEELSNGAVQDGEWLGETVVPEPPSPTITPTPRQTATPTSTPTPSLTPTPCPFPVDLDLSDVWRRDTFGCASSEADTIWAAWQSFENGYMLWRSDPRAIVVFCSRGACSGTWTQWPDPWREGTPIPDAVTPPCDEAPPVIRGFGYLWGSQEQVRDQLGCATGDEHGFCARVQDFRKGSIFHSTDGPCPDGEGNLYETSDGFLERYEELFFSLEGVGSGTWKPH